MKAVTSRLADLTRRTRSMRERARSLLSSSFRFSFGRCDMITRGIAQRFQRDACLFVKIGPALHAALAARQTPPPGAEWRAEMRMHDLADFRGARAHEITDAREKPRATTSGLISHAPLPCR